MNKQEKYDPEDMESLMMHKSFEELYPEEKAFVLKHLDGPEDYESMRKTLFAVRKEISDGSSIKPSTEVKARLLEQFVSEESRGWKLWLNSLFTLPERRQWSIPLGIAAVSILVWFLAIDQNSPVGQLAENKVNEEQIDKEVEKTEAKSTAAEENMTDEIISEVPEAPEVEVLEDSPMEDIEMFDDAEMAEEDLAIPASEDSKLSDPVAENIVEEAEENYEYDEGQDISQIAEAKTFSEISESAPATESIVNYNSQPSQSKELFSTRATAGIPVSNNATADQDLFDLLYTSY